MRPPSLVDLAAAGRQEEQMEAFRWDYRSQAGRMTAACRICRRRIASWNRARTCSACRQLSPQRQGRRVLAGDAA